MMLCERFEGCDFYAANKFRLSQRQYDLMVNSYCKGKLQSNCRRIKWRQNHDGTEPPNEQPPTLQERAYTSPIWFTP